MTYFSQKKFLVYVLFAASAVFQRMKSSQIQHFCRHGTAFSISDELCTGCDSKSKLHVIICSVSKTPKPKEVIFHSKGQVAAPSLLHTFLPPFPLLQPLFLKMLFVFPHTHECRFCNFKVEENSGSPKADPLFICYEQEEKWVLKQREVQEIFFTIFNSHLHGVHQTTYVFLNAICPVTSIQGGTSLPFMQSHFPFLKVYLQEATQ